MSTPPPPVQNRLQIFANVCWGASPGLGTARGPWEREGGLEGTLRPVLCRDPGCRHPFRFAGGCHSFSDLGHGPSVSWVLPCLLCPVRKLRLSKVEGRGHDTDILVTSLPAPPSR